MSADLNDSRLTRVICSTPSAICSLIIIAYYRLYPAKRTRSAKLVVFLSLANLSLSVCVLLDAVVNTANEDACTFLAFFEVFNILASVGWTVAMSMTMSFVILKRDRLLQLLTSSNVPTHKLAIRRMVRFHLFCWAGAGVLAAIPAVTDSYTCFTDWNRFKTTKKSHLVALACYYLPLAAAFAYNFFVLVRLRNVRSKYRNERPAEGENFAIQLLELAISLKNYPLVTMSVTLWAILSGIVYFEVGVNDNTRWIFIMLIALQQSQGVINMLIFFKPRHWRHKFLGLFGLEHLLPIDDLSDRSSLAGNLNRNSANLLSQSRQNSTSKRLSKSIVATTDTDRSSLTAATLPSLLLRMNNNPDARPLDELEEGKDVREGADEGGTESDESYSPVHGPHGKFHSSHMTATRTYSDDATNSNDASRRVSVETSDDGLCLIDVSEDGDRIVSGSGGTNPGSLINRIKELDAQNDHHHPSWQPNPLQHRVTSDGNLRSVQWKDAEAVEGDSERHLDYSPSQAVKLSSSSIYQSYSEDLYSDHFAFSYDDPANSYTLYTDEVDPHSAPPTQR